MNEEGNERAVRGREATRQGRDMFSLPPASLLHFSLPAEVCVCRGQLLYSTFSNSSAMKTKFKNSDPNS